MFQSTSLLSLLSRSQRRWVIAPHKATSICSVRPEARQFFTRAAAGAASGFPPRVNLLRLRTQIRHSKETATRSSALLNLRPRFAFSSFPNHVITAKTTNFSFRSAGDNESEHNRILGISYQTAACCYDDNLMKNLSLDGEQRCEARIEQLFTPTQIRFR